MVITRDKINITRKQMNPIDFCDVIPYMIAMTATQTPTKIVIPLNLNPSKIER